MSYKPVISFALAIICAAGAAGAQNPLASETRSARLEALSEQIRQRDASQRELARDYARRLGIPLRRNLPGGGVLELQRYLPGLGPRFYISNNVDAADTVSTDEVWPGGAAGLALDGSGMLVSQWDVGRVYAHPDLTGRLAQADGATVISGHSTHVAGTLIGSGAFLLPEARGMAWAADLDAYDWNFDTAEMAAAAASGLLISNHSYGIAAGWIYIGDIPPNTWWWIGGAAPTDLEDPYFGYYDAESQLWDQIAFDAPYYLIVKAAGNDRSDTGPAPGEEYTVIDQDGTPLFTSTLARPPDCAPLGYDCLPTHSVAKNILTVGAVDDVPGGYAPLSGPAQVSMSPFSSWGPSDDGRIKPDLVGNGVFLLSLWPEPEFYAAAAGTSMAAPNVTGSLLLLQQHYENVNGPNQFLRAASLKALAIHSADEAGEAPGPDYAFGFGLLNTRTAAEIISGNGGGDHLIVEGTLAQGVTDTIPFTVNAADASLKATLVWADPPGTPVPLVLDAPDLMLVNDLDLRVSMGGTTHFPWVLDPANPSAAATTGDNFRDNVEQVVIQAAAAGAYSIEVSHDDALQGGLPQQYSLIISELAAPPTGSGLLIDENFSGGLPAGWTVDTVMGIPWTINAPIFGDPRLDNYTGGSGNFAVVDNNYANQTITSLRTPVLDLSANDAAVLRFNSYMYYDTFESINVDVSTDGGSSWLNAWQFQGFNPFPTQVVLDLSAIAGEPAAMIRWRFDSEGFISGDIWQVDNVQFEVFGGEPGGDPPGPATGPSPADGALSVNIDADLSWSAGAGATSHDVYFGTSTPLDGGDFQANQLGTGFDPGTLAYSTTYYWRIDEVNAEGFATGPTWSFTTEAAPPVLPGPASNPVPGNGAADINIDADLSWTAGAGADSHDVYFGTVNPPGAGEFQANQAGTGFEPGTLAHSTTYYWRIDEMNAGGTTTGTVWSFTTEAAPPPPPPGDTIHLAGLAGTALPPDKGRWTAQADISVHDVAHTPEAGVTVDGNWGNGANGSDSCVTDAGGQCSVSQANLKNNVTSVTFTVTSLSKPGFGYAPGDDEAAGSVVIGPGTGDQQPVAVNDSYSTGVDEAVNGNLLNNDSPGDGPAQVNSHTEPASGLLSLNADGSFTYSPNGGFEGEDSFQYDIVDTDGDVSNLATVNIAVTAAPPPGGHSVSVSPYKIKGEQHVDISWNGYAGGTVDISRDATPIASGTANDGAHTDNIGLKGGGVSYLYTVCESGTSNCASATAIF